MLNQDDVQIWENRWKALKSVINERKENPSNISIDRKETFKVLLSALQTFGERQFNFFCNGFAENPDDGFDTLEESEQYPAEFVLRWTLDQLSYDLNVIENAIKQREDDNKKITLKQADLLAFRAIEPIINKNEDDVRLLPDDTTVITYFQKSPQVRLIPYAPVALIGVPYSAIEQVENSNVSNGRDFLAIPHEVGHFVYWYGRLNGKRLRVLLQQRLSQNGWKKYAHWLEEIFADVYGCMIGGSAMALSFQDLQMDNLPATWIEDDGNHPAAVIRPYIYNQVLEDNVDGKTLTKLKVLWNDRLALRGKPSFFRLRGRANNAVAETITVDEVDEAGKVLIEGQGEKELSEIISIIQEVLDPSWFGDYWVEDISNENDPASSLYELFAKRMAPDDSSNDPLNITSFSDVPNFEFPAPSLEAEVEAVVEKSSGVLESLRSLDVGDNNKPADVWTIVMNADGWGTGGPECAGSGGVC